MVDGVWLAIAAVVSLGISVLGARRNSLSRSGLIGATCIGTVILGLGGWRPALLLGLFFVSSSALSRYKEEAKRQAAEKFDKGHARDFGQTMANGGVATLIILIAVLGFELDRLWLAALIGAFATVTADTWATEIGTLSMQTPRSVLNGKPVPPGTSGGVTWLGSGAAAAGSLLIGLSGGVLYPSIGILMGGLIGLAGGLIGSFADSYLGATVQAMYVCEVCGQETERVVHHGRSTRLIRGWRWLSNDWVNFWASWIGAGGAWLIGWLI